MKQLLTILIFIFALPLSDVFAQHNEPLPNAVLKMDAGYSIKGNKVTAIDKTTMSTKNTSIPSSQAVQTAINSALTTTGSFYKINPPSTALYTGITTLDTNTINYGSVIAINPLWGGTGAGIQNKRIYVENYDIPTYAQYSIGIQDSVSTSLNFNRVQDGGGGTFSINQAGFNNTAKRTFLNIEVNRYVQDSTLSIASGFNNNATFFTRYLYNKDCNLKLNQGIYYGWTRPYGGSYVIEGSNVNLTMGNINQYLPYSIFASGDNGYGFIFGQTGTITNSNITIEVNNAYFSDNAIYIAATLVNSTITIKVNNAHRYTVARYTQNDPMIYIGASTDATSRIIIEGNFLADKKPVVEIATNCNTLLKGVFETKSTTEGAIKLSLTAANVKLQGLLKTGHTESITAAGAYSISVLPGSAANKAVGATVTQVGGTITVNAGY